MSRTTIFYKAKPKAHITYIAEETSIQRRRKPCYSREIHVPLFGNSRQNPRHANARGREESLELHSIL